MSDSFINNLNESKNVNPNDFVPFDIFDQNLGDFYTKKINFGTLSRIISTNIMNDVQPKINTIQSNVNDAKAIALQKLDRRGYEFNREIERMIGTLVLNNKLSALSDSDFDGEINVHNHGIHTLADAVYAQDAVNKRYLDGRLIKYLPLSGGTMTGSIAISTGFIDMSGNRIKNVPDTTDTTSLSDAVNKKYVDLRTITYFLPLSGGTMTGSILMSTGFIDMSGNRIKNVPDATNSTSLSDAVNKKYVDLRTIGYFLPLSGGTMTGSIAISTGFIDMSGNRIKNVPDATDTTSLSDAVNKKYVDYRTSKYLPVSGGTLTDVLYLNGGIDKGSQFSIINPNNLNNTYIRFNAIGNQGNTDSVNIRQIGSNDYFHLSIDLKDNEIGSTTGQAFSIRNVDFNNIVTNLFHTNTLSGYVGIGTTDPNEKLTVVGNISASGKIISTDVLSALSSSDFLGKVNVHNNNIVNLSDPIDQYDAVNKKYVDLRTIGYFLPLSGGILTGNLILSTGFIDMSGNRIGNIPDATDNTSLSDAVNKKYVDYRTGSFYLPLSGGTMTGSLVMSTGFIDMSGNRILNVPDSLQDILTGFDDAINKRYVNTRTSKYLPLSGGTLNGPLTLLSSLSVTGFTNLSSTNFNNGIISKFSPVINRITLQYTSGNPNGDTYTLNNNDNGSVIYITALTNAYIAIPNDILVGFTALIIKKTTPNLTFKAVDTTIDGVKIKNVHNSYTMGGDPYGICNLICIDNKLVVIAGDLA